MYSDIKFNAKCRLRDFASKLAASSRGGELTQPALRLKNVSSVVSLPDQSVSVAFFGPPTAATDIVRVRV